MDPAGGPEGKTWLVEKHTISSIDFIKVDPAFGVRKPCGVGRCSVESQEFNEEFDLETTKVLATAGIRVVKDNVFEVDGLLVGVEICLDHNRGTEVFGSRTALEQKIDELKTTVDVQVIASAGMSIEWGPVAVTRDGPVFMADGFGKTEVSFNRYGLGLEDWHNDPTAFIQVDVLSTNIYHQYVTWNLDRPLRSAVLFQRIAVPNISCASRRKWRIARRRGRGSCFQACTG